MRENLQNRLINELLRGNLEVVKQLESQGASFLYPNSDGLYPLAAAVYGCSLETVRYVELKLKDDAENQWKKVDTNKAIEKIEKTKPTKLVGDRLGELVEWYKKYRKESWCQFYDTACLFREKYSSWQEQDWYKRGEDRELSDKYDYVRGRASVLGALLGQWEMSWPSLAVHTDVVEEIRAQLDVLRTHVETKALKQLNNTVATTTISLSSDFSTTPTTTTTSISTASYHPPVSQIIAPRANQGSANTPVSCDSRAVEQEQKFNAAIEFFKTAKKIEKEGELSFQFKKDAFEAFVKEVPECKIQ